VTERDDLVHLLLTELAHWSHVLRRTVEGPFVGASLTRSQRDALFLVAHLEGPVTPGRLARSLDLTAGAVTQLLDGLVAAGLVVRGPHPDDARSRVVTLSPRAVADVAAAESAAAARLAPRFEDLDSNDLQVLLTLLLRTRADL
jgi:DNA-binding MarR family transcriptional regulator